MSSFLAAAPTPTTTPPDQAVTAIENDGWFPDIDVSQMRESTRIDGTVTDTRLIDAIVSAVMDVNRLLADWQQRQANAGFNSLGDVPAPSVRGISQLLELYNRAIYCTAKADLMERYRDFDTTSEGNKKADLMTCPIEEQRRNAQWAIADIEGRTRVTVDLI